MTVRVEQELPDALFWDDAEPYHYTRRATTDDPGLIIVGGSDHKTGQGDDERDAFHHLERYVRQRFAVQKIEQRWSAEFFEPADGLPYVGRVPSMKHVYLGTGYSGTGLTFGTVAGRLLADLVLDRANPMSDIFSPSRIKPLAAGGSLIKENLNAAKHFVLDRFTGDSIESLEEVPPGKGRLVKYEGKQWAIYRDDEGAIHVLSPVCTHMGCHVQWNEAEKTWDCPCHGGRFSCLGERLYGPPPKDLEEQALAEL
jgi:Rieske Fe-S protein